MVRVEDELVEILDTGFRDAVAAALSSSGSEQLGAVLRALGPSLEAIDRFDAALVALVGKSGTLPRLRFDRWVAAPILGWPGPVVDYFHSRSWTSSTSLSAADRAAPPRPETLLKRMA